VLFFDGPSPGGASDLGSLSLRYSGGEPADDRIVAEIARSGSPSDVVVVTGDRGLARRAKEAGARAMAPKDFWARFGASAAAAGEEPAVDVEEWLRYFSDESNRG